MSSSSAMMMIDQHHQAPQSFQSQSSTVTSVSALEKLQAGAFRSLLQHLQNYSNEISNIDLMTTSGFCRNCLAKVRFGISIY